VSKSTAKANEKSDSRGIGKRRICRKLHFCVNEATLEIINVVAGANDFSATDPKGPAKELLSKSVILSRMTRLGMSDSVKITLANKQFKAGDQYLPNKACQLVKCAYDRDYYT
jgi:hypothetical protein